MGAPVRVTAPGVLPVSLAEAKAHLRVDFSDDDALIALYLASAVDMFDARAGVLGRCLINQEWRFTLSAFPAGTLLALPFPDVSAVAVTYFDTENTSQTFSSASYALIEKPISADVVLLESADWPATYSRPDAVTVTFTAGFGAAAADVPPMIRQAILHTLADLYQRREAFEKPGTFADRVVAIYGRTGIGAASS